MTIEDWYRDHGAAASAEGWCLFDSHGSCAGPWQPQAFDDPADTGYEGPPIDDMGVWQLLRGSDKPHHVATMQYLAVHNPLEYIRILAYPTVIDGEWDYDAETVAWHTLSARPKVEVLHERHPDEGCGITVWLNGRRSEADVVGIDPGRGHVRSEWTSAQLTESNDPARSQEFRAAIHDAYEAHSESYYIEED